MKGNINSNHRILDAGCGGGRNLSLLINNDWNAVGIDSNQDVIHRLQARFPNKIKDFIVSSVEEYDDNSGFDAIICNAVLHFAEGHNHFDAMFESLNNNLKPGGLLFIRMTSNIGLDLENVNSSGVYLLPDNSRRYLITKNKIEEVRQKYPLRLEEPIKTVNVNDLRCMTTLVFRKIE